jgi:hypothetical protein
VIYVIECLPTGLVYVGLSSDYRQRWRAHRVQLRRGSHTAAGMNVDWRKYGEAAFKVRVLGALPYDVETPDAQKEELPWQAHSARLGACTTCRFAGCASGRSIISPASNRRMAASHLLPAPPVAPAGRPRRAKRR